MAGLISPANSVSPAITMAGLISPSTCGWGVVAGLVFSVIARPLAVAILFCHPERGVAKSKGLLNLS